MTNDEELHALYTFRGEGKRQPPLYIGRSNDVLRRIREHQATKPWITQTSRIDLQWYPRDEIPDAERRAIESKHPVYNIVHNGGRLRIEATAEITFSPPTVEDLAALCAMGLAGGMLAVWAFDSVANWSVRQRAERAGQQVELPPARNLFAQDPPHWSATLLQALLALATPTAADPQARRETIVRVSAMTQGQMPRPE